MATVTLILASGNCSVTQWLMLKNWSLIILDKYESYKIHGKFHEFIIIRGVIPEAIASEKCSINVGMILAALRTKSKDI
jgi:hypothetical protein